MARLVDALKLRAESARAAAQKGSTPVSADDWQLVLSTGRAALHSDSALSRIFVSTRRDFAHHLRRGAQVQRPGLLFRPVARTFGGGSGNGSGRRQTAGGK